MYSEDKSVWEGHFGLPTNGQLTMILENLFDRQRLIELALRCTTRAPDTDLRQVKISDLIEILVNAWELGPQKPWGSLWGAVNQELSGRLKSYLGLGTEKLREMLSALRSESSFDPETASIMLWVLLHEKHEKLFAEFEPVLNRSYREIDSHFRPNSQFLDKITEFEKNIGDLGRELKGMILEQTHEIEKIGRRLKTIEEKREAAVAPPSLYSGDSEALRRRMMNIPEEKLRVGVFVDVQNMFYAAKKLDGARLDYDSMLDRIVRRRRLVKAVAYIVESSDINQSGFISVLEKKGYQVRRKELKSFLDGTAKGDWDMGMAIDIIEMATYLDVVALVTGDGDFVSLVRLVKKIGPKVELYAFGHNLSSELREVCDQFFEIGSELLLKNHHHQATGPAEEGTREKEVQQQTQSDTAGKPNQRKAEGQ